MKYGRGFAEGFYSYDTFRLGGLRAAKQIFAEATNTTTFDGAKYDGVLGLGFPLLNENIKSPLDNFQEQGFITERHFSLKLNSDISSKYGGELVIGGVDEVHIVGKMHFYPVTKANHWQFRMESVSVQKEDVRFCDGGCEAILNSGSSVILGPTKEIHRLNVEVLKATKIKGFDRYFLHCPTINKLPSISFTMKDRSHRIVKYSLRPRHYTQIFKVCAFVGAPFSLTFSSSLHSTINSPTYRVTRVTYA